MTSMKWYLFEERSKYKEALREVEEVIRESIEHVKKEESKPKNEQQATIRWTDSDLDAPTATKASVHLERSTANEERSHSLVPKTGNFVLSFSYLISVRLDFF